MRTRKRILACWSTRATRTAAGSRSMKRLRRTWTARAGLRVRTTSVRETELLQNAADYVARMDCDDVCDPVRLEREVAACASSCCCSCTEPVAVQVAFLEAHPEVDAVGASVDVFNCRAESDPAAPSRVVEHPTAAGAVLWTMLFACAIAHPSSMVHACCGGCCK